MAGTFNLDQLTALVDEFVNTVPSILRGNPLTADLVSQVDRLTEESESPFTLAVVGQMRIGKSSLMNGLIGKELAVVGVNETTATINYFKYGEGDLTNRFRVHWKGEHFEELPCSEISHWVGESEHASRSKFLEFFDDSEFFKKIHLVDTPGTRSVISDHSELINNFLAEKRERETLQHGGKADAILYVSGAVANVAAEDMLKDFQDNTRLPGSSPYNSVAVLHKWEILNVERPHEEAQNKASLMEKQFEKFVSKVIPVSGPLALASKTLGQDFWNDLIKLIQEKDLRDLQKYLERGDSRFKSRIENGEKLLTQSRLPWACFRTILSYAIQEGIEEGEELRRAIFKMSGIEALMAFIEERFIERRKLIKSLTILKKAIEPCHVAQLRMKSDIEKKEKLLNSAEQSLSLLDNYITKENEFLKPVSQFIHSVKTPFRKELEKHKQTQRDLGMKTGHIEECYTQIIGDLKTLSLLDSHSELFSESEMMEIRYLCGSYGFSVQERTACYAQDPSRAFDDVLDRLEFWSSRRMAIESRLKPLIDHIEIRLEEIADELEMLCEQK